MTRFEDDLREVVIPCTTASLEIAGITRHMLGGPSWRRVSRGLHVPRETLLTTTQRIVEAAAAAGPCGVVGGWAAAYAYGTDQLDGLNDFTMRRLPVPLLLPRTIHRASNPAFDYRQDHLGSTEVNLWHDIRLTSPIRTALDLACWADNATEAVVGLDAMLTAGVVDLSELSTRLPLFAGHPGSRRAAAALELAVSGARSSWESRLRMICVRELGWKQLAVNAAVFDDSGRFLGAPDLLDEEAGLAIEYDGVQWPGSEVSGGHRNREQHRSDNVREEGFERVGLLVVRCDKVDMTRHRAELKLRLQSARRQGLARDRRLDRWRTSRRSA